MIDGRNLYDPAEMREVGFTYRGIGRGYNDATRRVTKPSLSPAHRRAAERANLPLPPHPIEKRIESAMFQ